MPEDFAEVSLTAEVVLLGRPVVLDVDQVVSDVLDLARLSARHALDLSLDMVNLVSKAFRDLRQR